VFGWVRRWWIGPGSGGTVLAEEGAVSEDVEEVFRACF
jgi:hypothetical protein